ncbi:glutamyl-tRNA synthetase [Trichophyton equinum CBS 127.97]|uniref:glutamate--tRNA ligase n=1 Tax=Trichophyton equinum (strain ATCC MYA-4606 / CBS 127.97) TaxID=559882 RepID=F2PKU5_TRIEC|nr:glutamyl-tRNA synthetase [Trichophyton equinum CBS 127.97]
MSVLTVALKAPGETILPAVAVASCLIDASPKAGLTIVYEESDKVGSKGGKVELKTDDGALLYDAEIIPHLRDKYEVLQAGNKEQVDEWLKRALEFTRPDFKAMDKPMKELESHLTLRSYIVGYGLTLADLVVWATLRGNRVTSGAVKRFTNSTGRWFNFIETMYPWIGQGAAEMAAGAMKKKAAASAAGASYNIGLPDTDKGVVTRFPPEPSGYLHIGHAKAALLNDYFAHEAYKGTLICRFDDTNPSNESQEFVDAITYDLSLLGIFPDRISFSSDYFQEMYEDCIKIIKSGNAYADDTEKEQMQHERFEGIASKRRDESVEDNLARFAEMKTGSEEGQRWCIRAKISVDDTNKAMRDPVIYRCNLTPHHRTGDTWKIYPTYDFCVPILDSLEGVTHALRTNEYNDRNPQYAWFQKTLGIRSVHIWDFSRLNFIKTLLSKRKLTKIVDQGMVWGWDDPRMPTIRGIRRRGMTIPSLREYILKQGPSRNIINMDWTTFWSNNRKYIDPTSPRHTGIDQEDMVPGTVSGATDADLKPQEKPKHPKNPELGTKTVYYSKDILFEQEDAKSFKQDEEITLMNWGNAIVRKITTDAASGKVTGLDLELHLAGDFKKTEKKVTWLARDQKLVPAEIYEFDYLITKDKIEKDEDFEQFLNPKTEIKHTILADCNLVNLKKGESMQFERKGYYILDQEPKDGQPAILFNIPTGKS